VPFTTVRGPAEPQPHPAGAVTGWSGRVWQLLTADLSAWCGAKVRLRWRYATDQLYVGRGVYVDGLRVEDRGRPVFDEARPGDAALIEVNGWTASRD
jgi:bacillopeptidase F (M6 metalloprotease family)